LCTSATRSKLRNNDLVHNRNVRLNAKRVLVESDVATALGAVGLADVY
jgi:hypothetical protein